MTSHRFFNFVVTGYSLIDWIKHDPAVSPGAKAEWQSLYSNPWLTVCGDVANAAKHFKLTTRPPIVSGVTAKQGYGLGGFGKGPYGVGEEEIEIHLLDGTTYGLFELVNGVLQTWAVFFERHGIPGGNAARPEPA